MAFVKSYSRQGIFARLMSEDGLVYGEQKESFGLFMEVKIKQKFTPPFDIHEAVKAYFGVSTCGSIHERDLAILIGEYDKLRKKEGKNGK